MLIFHGAASPYSGVAKFAKPDAEQLDENLDVGGSIASSHNIQHGNSYEHFVQRVDMNRMLQRIQSALISRGSGVRRGKVVVKCDIEGSEFDLIPSLIFSQTICLTDVIFIEWHKLKRNTLEKVAAANNLPRERSGTAIVALVQNLLMEFNHLLQLPGVGSSCPTTVIDMDDETYLRDTVVLGGAIHDIPFPNSSVC